MPERFAPKAVDEGLIRALSEVDRRFRAAFDAQPAAAGGSAAVPALDAAARPGGSGVGRPTPNDPLRGTPPPALEAQRFALGPGAVARTIRRSRAARPSFAERLADTGLAVTRFAAQAVPEPIVVDGSAPSAIVCAAIAARAEAGRAVPIAVVGAAKAWLDPSLEALAPLVDRKDVDIQAADDSAQEAAVGRVVFAPYYYASGDLDRMALELALDLLLPPPGAEAGLELLVPRGWDQRDLFAERLAKRVEALSKDMDGQPRPFTSVILETSSPLATLEAAKTHVLAAKPRLLSAFVYPMWRERAAVESALDRLLATSTVSVVNHRPSLAWTLGVGASLGRVVVDGDPRLRPVASLRTARRHKNYESAPSMGRALGIALANWTGI